MLAVRFYDAVVSLHVMAVVIAFGVTFAYPVLVPYITRNHPTAVPAMYDAMALISKRFITPAATVALLLGAYLATDAEVWDEVWVTVPLLVMIALLGLAGAVFGPTETKLAALTRRDLDAGGTFSPEVDALVRREAVAGTVANLLVLLAIYFMVAKPFA